MHTSRLNDGSTEEDRKRARLLDALEALHALVEAGVSVALDIDPPRGVYTAANFSESRRTLTWDVPARDFDACYRPNS